MSETLYRFWAKSRLLYVGISINAFARASQHRRDAQWWPEATKVTFEKFPDRQAVLAAEALAIKSEHPQYNIMHNRGLGDDDRLVTADGHLTVLGAMAYTHVARGTFAALRRKGDGPKYTAPTPKTILYKKEWLDEWLVAGEVKAA